MGLCVCLFIYLLRGSPFSQNFLTNFSDRSVISMLSTLSNTTIIKRYSADISSLGRWIISVLIYF